MAEGKGANIARLMTKQAGRAKEKVIIKTTNLQLVIKSK